MKQNDKVKIIESPYKMFDFGTEHSVYALVGDLIYLVDPFYIGTENEEDALWPFLEDELEIIS